MRSVSILFGSQTGNSESIAKEVHEKLVAAQIESSLSSLNDATTVLNHSKDCIETVVIVCSTTGAGDAPDNADKFWRTIKKRTMSKDAFHGVSYCVLALGDTNYDKYCNMGKSIDKRLHELGGHRFLELCCADEATGGLEQLVEMWSGEMMSCLMKINVEESHITDLNLNEKYVGEVGYAGNDDTRIANDNDHQRRNHSLVQGVASMSVVCSFLGIPVASLFALPDASLLLKSRKAAAGALEILSDGDGSVVAEGFELNSSGEYSVSQPFEARVMDAAWLTKHDDGDDGGLLDENWGKGHDVIRLELDINGSGIQYQPGDYISIVAPNPNSCVALVIDRIKISGSRPEKVISTSREHDEVVITANTRIRRNGETLSVQELFQYRLDLVGPPRKPCVFALSEHCLDEAEASAMKWLCSKGDIGKSLWAAFIESQSLGVAELLSLFPSCCPPLHVLANHLSPLSPRPYSIASSPLAHPRSVVLAFSRVRYCCGLASNLQCCGAGVNQSEFYTYSIRRSGMCTSYLEDTLQQYLLSDISNVAEVILLRILWKPSISFRLPGNVSSPLILIGPGTGVAPFIGFLEHRAESDKERSQSGEDTTTGLWRGGFELDEACKLPHEGNAIDNFIQLVHTGPMFLFYGCRNEEDWIFKDEMLQFVEDGTLFSLDVALSRQHADKKVYVTHKLLDKGKELVPMILCGNAYIYICGDGTQMAKDVMNTLVTMLQVHGDQSEECAHEFLQEMKSRRRLLMDVWS